MATYSGLMRAGSQSSTGSAGAHAGMQQRRYSRYSKQQERPYPKGDITVELQKLAQEFLREAAHRYEGFNADNLEIIAVSFEHKTFLESSNSKDYFTKIKTKLHEWHYQDTANPPPAPLKDAKSSPSAQKKGSDSSSGPVKVSKDRPPSRDKVKQQQQSVLNSAFKTGGSPNMPNATQPSGGSPNFAFSGTPNSPGGSNNQPTTPPFAPFSPTMTPSGEFVGLMHPALLDSLDLNEPNTRSQWTNALRDSIVSELRENIFAEVYATLGSSAAGLPALINSPTRTGPIDFGLMEVDHNQHAAQQQQQQQQQHQHHSQTAGGQANGGTNGAYGLEAQGWYTPYNPHTTGTVGNPANGGGMFAQLNNDAQSFNAHMVGNWYNHQ
ncbi:hypothetical protein DRE_01164 [Drechslerella stenobrocha 248]|uniref:Mediator complex subunit 15 KIX domain-containing protein n=1 Tax=Drechslerella stenobrocha 248 TaxID=1043628 RepID=W7HWM4_9PEZI|nr:hypothetical protein DRE_01164 [Drechslerella stenobrocha 248]